MPKSLPERNTDAMAVQTMRIDPRVGAERDLHAGRECAGQVLVSLGYHGLRLLLRIRRPIQSGQVLDHPIFQVNRGHQIRPVLFHQPNAFGVDVASMLDGICASQHGVPYSRHRVSVRGYFAAEAMRRFHDRLDLLGAILRKCWVVAFRYNPTRGHELNYVGAVLNVFPNLSYDCRYAVCNAVFRELKLRREIVFVLMTTRDAQRWSGHQHAGTRYVSRIDCVSH